MTSSRASAGFFPAPCSLPSTQSVPTPRAVRFTISRWSKLIWSTRVQLGRPAETVAFRVVGRVADHIGILFVEPDELGPSAISVELGIEPETVDGVLEPVGRHLEVDVMVLVNRHVPLVVHAAGDGRVSDAGDGGKPLGRAAVADAPHRFGRAPVFLGRLRVAFAPPGSGSGPLAQVRVLSVPSDSLAVVEHPDAVLSVLAQLRSLVVRERRELGEQHVDGVAVHHEGVAAAGVLEVPSPVSVVYGCPGVQPGVLAQDERWHVLFQWDRLHLTHPDPDDALRLLDRIRLHAHPAPRRAVGAVREVAETHAILHVVRPAVVAAADGVRAGKFILPA